MKVIWQPEADKGRIQIAKYIRRNFGKKIMVEFMETLQKVTKLLSQFPDIGRIDPLFKDRANTYRCLIVNKLSKLVYRIDGDVVNIVAFWDCRQEPKNQAAQVK